MSDLALMLHACAILAQASLLQNCPPPRPYAPHFSNFNRFNGLMVDGDGSGSIASRTVSIRLTNHHLTRQRQKERMHTCALSKQIRVA